MTPTSDATRVIGQIQRGEVQAGAEGARRIAAKAEAAYGDVWAHDTARADAIAALNGGDAR